MKSTSVFGVLVAVLLVATSCASTDDIRDLDITTAETRQTDPQQPTSGVLHDNNTMALINDFRQTIYEGLLYDYPDLADRYPNILEINTDIKVVEPHTAETTIPTEPEVVEPQLFQVDCPYYVPIDFKTGCFVVLLPISRDDQSLGPTFISVAVKQGSKPDSFPPVVILQGGPGAASTELIPSAPELPFTQIYIDQRGTGFGSVDFRCPEIRTVLPELLGASGNRSKDIEAQAYTGCLDRLTDDLTYWHMSTAAHAEDVLDVMALLEYQQWAIYGVSYGTTIALEVLGRQPDGIVSAVLDSVYPNGIDLDTHLAHSAPYALGQLINDFYMKCQITSGCDLNFMVALDDAINTLNADPVVIELTAEDTSLQEGVSVFLNGDLLANIIFQLMYEPNAFSLIPILVHGSYEKEPNTLRLAAILLTEVMLSVQNSISHGTYFAIMCRERLHFASGVPHQATVYAKAILQGGLASLCDAWVEGEGPAPDFVSTISDSLRSSGSSDVPILAISGSHDPITPTYLAQTIAARFPNITVVRRGGLSHSIWFTDECTNVLIETFLFNPHYEIELDCIRQSEPISWDAYFDHPLF